MYIKKDYINAHGPNGDIYAAWHNKREQLKSFYYGSFDTGGYIAYAAIALQSKEGLIVVGLGVIFLIILFILAELWRKDDEEEEEDSEEDSEEVQPEEKLSRKERKRRKKEEKRSRKQAKKGSAEETASEEGKLSLFADAAEELSEKVPEIEETIVEPDTDQTIDLQAIFEGTANE